MSGQLFPALLHDPLLTCTAMPDSFGRMSKVIAEWHIGQPLLICMAVFARVLLLVDLMMVFSLVFCLLFCTLYVQ